MTDLLSWIVLFGGPGLLLGAGLGAVLPRWWLVVVAAALSFVGLWFGLNHLPESGEDDDPVVLVAIAMVTNVGGWILGLVLGAGIVRVRRRLKTGRVASPARTRRLKS